MGVSGQHWNTFLILSLSLCRSWISQQTLRSPWLSWRSSPLVGVWHCLLDVPWMYNIASSPPPKRLTILTLGKSLVGPVTNHICAILATTGTPWLSLEFGWWWQESEHNFFSPSLPLRFESCWASNYFVGSTMGSKCLSSLCEQPTTNSQTMPFSAFLAVAAVGGGVSPWPSL